MDSLSTFNSITSEQDKALKKIAWSIEASEEEFKLIFVHCNYVNLQHCLSERLQELCEIETLYIQSTDKQLYTVIKNQIEATPKAIQLLGLAQVHLLEDVLKSADRVRDDFKKNLPYPLVIWVNNKIQTQFKKVAPNFESWGITISLPITVDFVNDFLQNKVTFVLNSPFKLTSEEVNGLNEEVIAAKEYLSISDRKACFYLNFLLGYLEEKKRYFDRAISYYKESKKNLDSCSFSELFKVGLWVHLTYCSYVQASQSKDIQGVDKWTETKDYLDTTLEILETVTSQVVAKFLGSFGNILIQFKYLDKLKELAEIALEIHKSEKSENNCYTIAQDISFLAEVCLFRKQWHEGINLGQEGLRKLQYKDIFVHENVKMLYRISPLIIRLLLIIGKGKVGLKKYKEAINILEAIKYYPLNLDEPNVYIEILEQLHKLYFEQEQKYLEAFNISKKIITAKRLAGQFAFIGLSQIVLPIVENQENIAPEIVASGRENDVKRLVERVLRKDYKVIVIYGESGVGKSALINGGLIPCLRSKILAEGKIYPICIRVYSSWIDELLSSLRVKQLIEEDNHKEKEILNQLQILVDCKLRPVLIFDQFEEFFFVKTTTKEQHYFFYFLGKCLDLSNLKIVFSLRKDYVHYLLDVPGMERISNDILGKEVLYKIDDFTPKETKDIIHKITKPSQFKLDDDLIDQLVEDLTEDDRIRPIELQIVGSQLQQKNITTLREYHQSNGAIETSKYKEKLVQDFLDILLKDVVTKMK